MDRRFAVVEHLLAQPLRRVAGIGAAVIAGVLLLGLVAQFALPWGSSGYHLLNMDGERSVPAVVSGGLLLSAGLVALLLAPPSLLNRLLGAGLVYAAFDEVFALHEHLQRWTGVNWIKLYLPVFAAAAVVGLLLVLRMRRDAPRAVPFLLGGVVCWGVAQSLEWFEWGGTDVARPGYLAMMFSEETLEDVGSLLFLLAGLVIARRWNGVRLGRVDGSPAVERRTIGTSA